MAANLPPLPDVEELSTNIIRVMGGNPSKYTLQGSNTYILGTGSQRILLDTAQGFPKWKANLSEALQKHDCSISLCLLSHWHHDHLGGVQDLISLSSSTSRPTIHKNQPSLNPDNLIDPSTTVDIINGQKFSTTGIELTALHTPGHTADHMCFMVTGSSDPSEIGAIFTADNVLGHGTAVFEDLDAYVSSLKLMHSAVSAAVAAKGSGSGSNDKNKNFVVKAYPGHGQVIDDAVTKIHEYIEHRKMREEEVLNLLRYGTIQAPPSRERAAEVTAVHSSSGGAGAAVNTGGSVSKEWGSMEIVKVIYQQYPEALHLAAEGGVKHVLHKLLKEGKVIYHEETTKWKASSEKAAL